MSRWFVIVGLAILSSSVALAEGPPVDMIPRNPPSKMRSIEEIRREAGLVGLSFERDSSKKKRHSKRKPVSKPGKKSSHDVAKKAKPARVTKSSLIAPRAER